MKPFILVILLSFSWAGLSAQQNDRKAIKACFENYKTAILSENGEDATSLISQKTVAYYQRMLAHSLQSDSLTIDSLSTMDKLMVFSLRHRTSVDSLLAFDGKKTIIYAIKKGMIGKSSVQHNTLGTINTYPGYAQALIVSRGVKTEMTFDFYKEESQWKLDLTSIFPVANRAFQKLVKDDGRSENEYLFYLLEMISGKKVSDTIWEPVVK